MENKPHIKQYIVTAAVSALHLALTFWTDKRIFEASPSDNPVDYYICKAIAFMALFAFYNGIFLILFRHGKEGGSLVYKNASGSVISDGREIGARLMEGLKCAAPYLIVIIPVCAFKLRGGYLSNDETLILQNALTLTHYTWFYYITTYYYIVALMLIPHIYGPIFLKLIIELMVVGYVVYRVGRYYGKRYGYGAYLLFLLYPVIAYTTSAHRLPIYFLVYLYLVVLMLFDMLEEIPANAGKITWIVFVSAILTQWRTEGIYFAVISVILILIAYPGLRAGKKSPVIALVAGALICQYLVSVPQNGFAADELSAKADDRMKPFYAYTVTNMFRNGLDREKNSQDLEIIDKYLSVETIDAINDYYGDINYEDVLILYADGFVGVREEASVEDFFNYAAACKRLFINNVDILLKTRWGAFCYAALPYHITFTGTGLRELASFGISIVKTLSYNLFIPVTIIILLCLFALIKRRWFTFFLSGGLLMHFAIVFVLAPASYFKYYFPIYMTAYFYVMLGIMQTVYNRCLKGEAPDQENTGQVR